MGKWHWGWWVFGAICAVLALVAFLLMIFGEREEPLLEEPPPPAVPPPEFVEPPPPVENSNPESAPGEEAEEEEPLEWDRPRFEERAAERREMVRQQIVERDVTDEALVEAMRHVPRHLFVPEGQRRQAHADRPLPIGDGQTISQPYIVAYMTELLELEPGDRVLEIGAGSGYHAAVISELTPYVFTIEIVEALAEGAAERLEELGYETIHVKHADGYYGWPEHAPFDAIIVTAAAGHVPPPLVEQLKPGGRMVLPVGGVFEVQRLVLVRKDEDGEVSTRSLEPVRFVPMTGRALEGE